MSFKVIVADDEAMARSRLVRLLGKCADDFEIIGEAGDGTTAIENIDRLMPDLVFLDIQMPGATGIEVAQKSSHKPFVIFVTAHSDFALDAFKTLAVDYILKPVEEDALVKAVEKFRKMVRPSNDFDLVLSQLATRVSSKAQQQRLSITTGESIKLVPYDDIICFEADQKYTTVFTLKDSYLTETSLNEFEQMLPGEQFVRIHRKHIVNFKFVDELTKWFDRRYKIKLTVPFKNELIVGRAYLDKVRNL